MEGAVALSVGGDAKDRSKGKPIGKEVTVLQHACMFVCVHVCVVCVCACL